MPRAVVGSVSLEVFEKQVDVAPEDPVQCWADDLTS